MGYTARARRYARRRGYKQSVSDDRWILYLMVFGLAPFTCGFSLAGLPALIWAELSNLGETTKYSRPSMAGVAKLNADRMAPTTALTNAINSMYG